MNVDTVLEKIKINIPELLIESYDYIDSGQNNIICIVNDEWVFRFPRYQHEVYAQRKEIAALKIIQGQTTLRVPEIEYQLMDSDIIGSVFSGYRKIQGTSFSSSVYRQADNKEELAEQIGKFLCRLHAIELSEFSSVGLSILDDRVFFEQMYIEVKDKLLSHMRQDAQDTIKEHFEEYLDRANSYKGNRCVIHGDFGPTNILYNDGAVSGIIDFSSVCIGNPVMDIASLIGKFGYGELFLKKMQAVYPGILDMLQDARFIAGTFALQDALFGLKHNDKETFDFGMQDYI